MKSNCTLIVRSSIVSDNEFILCTLSKSLGCLWYILVMESIETINP